MCIIRYFWIDIYINSTHIYLPIMFLYNNLHYYQVNAFTNTHLPTFLYMIDSLEKAKKKKVGIIMSRLLKVLFILMVSISPFSPFPQWVSNQTISHAQKPEPAYAKWGRLAMKETKEKYPNAQIIDYLHIGRTKYQSNETEKFKLWMRENQREYGVFVNITFNPETEKVIKMTFTETDR